MTPRRNLVIAFAQKHLQLLVSTASVIVLSRLVSPEETGIFSIGVAVTAMTHAVRDFGVGNYLIKEPETNPEQTRTAFTVSLLIAVVLSVVLACVARPVAHFYAQAEVADVVWITTLGLLISPFSTVNLALLMREQRFFTMFQISIAGTVAGALGSVGCAWLGLGARALALGSLANAAATVVAANLLYPRYGDYRPSLAHWRPIWRFGLHLTVSGVSEQVGGRAADLIVGKALGFASVGILSRSGTLIGMFQELVLASTAPVVLATMAGDARKGAGVSAMLLTSIEYASVVAWPFFAVLALFSHDAIAVLFGGKWLEAAPYTSILCAGAVLSVLPSLGTVATLASGHVHLLSRYNLISQGLRVGLIAVGSLSGLRAVAGLLAVAAALQSAVAYVLLRRAVPIAPRELIARTWRSLAVTALVAAAMVPVDLLAGYPALVRLLIVAATATPVWIAAMALVRHPAIGQVAAAIVPIIRELRRGRRAYWL